MEFIHKFFEINRSIVLFVYGLSFFVMGLVVFLQSRRHSRLRLARDLGWLAAFGILHGIHEWGYIFIPIQSDYLPNSIIEILWTIQILLLAFSFVCLLIFGAELLADDWPGLRYGVIALSFLWVAQFFFRQFTSASIETEFRGINIWARYLLAFPGGLLAAYGVRHQARLYVLPLINFRHIYRMLQIAGIVLGIYAILAGVMVPVADFFPASVINRIWIEHLLMGIPIEVLRSTAGLILAITIIRALEVFEIEIDLQIEQMEVERVQAAERERIGQEIHDGAIQGVYSASLILESLEPMIADQQDAVRRLTQARSVLNAVNSDLRTYMISLRTASPTEPLIPSLRALIADPRFQGMLDIQFAVEGDPVLKPMQINHLLAIVQESLSNILRHAHAKRVQITIVAVDNNLTLSIHDDGHGFATDSENSGYGLRSMRDRARLIGGNIEIKSTVGMGTEVTFTFQGDITPPSMLNGRLLRVEDHSS